MMYKELYRRVSSALVDIQDEQNVTSGKTYNWTISRPGYISFDYMCDVPLPSNLQIPDAWFEVWINDKKRFEVRGAWAWNRAFIFVDSGETKVEFKTVGFGGVATIRNLLVRQFLRVTDFDQIESSVPPKPVEQITSYQLLQGYQRYQRTGPRGCEIEFTLVFTDIAKWRAFMDKSDEVFIIKGDVGTYGGVIMPQDLDTVAVGPIFLTKVKISSPLTAGVGVDGL
jgi:hypothetical protein